MLGRLEMPATDRRGAVDGGQADRMLEQVRRRIRRASVACDTGRFLEGLGDPLVGGVGRQGKMPRPFLGIGHQIGEASVHRVPAAPRCLRVDGRTVDGVCESEVDPENLDDLGVDRRLQTFAGPRVCSHEHVERWASCGRRDQEQVDGGGRERPQSMTEEVVAESPRDGERLSGDPLITPSGGPGDLEREEGVPSRDPPQSLGLGNRHRDAEVFSDQCPELFRPERSYRCAAQTIGRQCVGDAQGDRCVGLGSRHEQANRLVREPSDHEREHPRRRLVQQVHVVDREHERRLPGDRLHDPERGDGYRVRVRPPRPR